MRYWFDTEFIERGPEHPIRLLSIGIVAEDGREFYAEIRDADRLIREDAHRFGDAWLTENVLPHLMKHDAIGRGCAACARTYDLPHLCAAILTFCSTEQHGKPEFWAYYADYDWVVLCQIFGRMIDLPKGWPMYCRDLKQLLDEHGNPPITKQDAAEEHNALNDARWTKRAWHEAKTRSVLP